MRRDLCGVCRHEGGHLEQRQEPTCITRCVANQLSTCVGIHLYCAIQAAGIYKRSVEQRLKIVAAERSQAEGAHAREERWCDRARRWLRCGAHQDDRARLHMRQQGILLRSRETMQLVNKEERLLAVFAALDRRGNRLADLSHAVACCGEARGDCL